MPLGLASVMHTAGCKLCSPWYGGSVQGRTHWPRPPAPPRHDAEAMAGFLERHGAQLPMRLFEVATLYWGRRRTRGEVATELGITHERVDNVIKEIRRIARQVLGVERPACPTCGQVRA